ncbi:unnamed protein product [Euphydryas editha]|uniref:DNA helicase Pif1-like 2B domain-containing protein n=1 Tax=Euphydryas editha TaxID=104508 RepID=A0AAU9TXL8_EUPED|nr:unnamed protein product [Euphydryas editha]
MLFVDALGGAAKIRSQSKIALAVTSSDIAAILLAGGKTAHTINLKLGVPIMLLRNLNSPKLCNGQTLQVASVDLSTSCFSHDQLYVTLSRVSNARKLHGLVPDGFTFTIFYREALL